MKLIVGLGNPGKEYVRHRHNIGFMVVDRLAQQHGLSFDRKQSKAKIAQGEIDDHRVILAKPQTYMNLSGLSVQGLVDKYRLPLAEIMVICDDLDLPAGKIRIRPSGGAGGHNGLKSIIAALGSQDFARLRIGIGRPAAEAGIEPVIDFVLTGFAGEEKEAIFAAIDHACESIILTLKEGLQAAMNRFNA